MSYERGWMEPKQGSIKQKTQSGQEPLKSSGSLNSFKSIDVTPVIGTEFPEANVVEWLNSPTADELLRDLVIKISERGVVFFRKQDNLTNDIQKQGFRGRNVDTRTFHFHL